MFIINAVSTCFRHQYAHLQENKDRVLLHAVYCVVGCEHCEGYCWTVVDNKHLIVASCWFSLSHHKDRTVPTVQLFH